MEYICGADAAFFKPQIRWFIDFTAKRKENYWTEWTMIIPKGLSGSMWDWNSYF